MVSTPKVSAKGDDNLTQRGFFYVNKSKFTASGDSIISSRHDDDLLPEPHLASVPFLGVCNPGIYASNVGCLDKERESDDLVDRSLCGRYMMSSIPCDHCFRARKYASQHAIYTYSQIMCL